jgi:O-methyltransferase
MKIEMGGKNYSLHDIEDGSFKKVLGLCAQNCMATQLGAFDVIYSVYNNIRYIVENQIPGDIVECGVWKGGLMQLAALTMLELGDSSRKIYLYDTFEGMPEPGEFDKDWNDISPHEIWKSQKWENVSSKGSKFGFGGDLQTIRATMEGTKYPADNLVFVKGLVEETIPSTIPPQIAYLRLDTDWYSSTAHELDNLFPVLSIGGVLVVDDYGYYKGSRKATDEYLKQNNIKILLSRVSALGVREGIKQ